MNYFLIYYLVGIIVTLIMIRVEIKNNPNHPVIKEIRGNIFYFWFGVLFTALIWPLPLIQDFVLRD